MEEDHNIHIDTLKDKPFIAGYFNLAVNHIIDLNRAIKKHFPALSKNGKKGQSTSNSQQEKDDKIDLSLKTLFMTDNLNKFSESDFSARLDFISSYFRAVDLVKYSSTANKVLDRNKFGKSINNFLGLLNDCRNYYTHYCHKKIVIDDTDIKELLEYMFIFSALDVKDKRLKSDQALRVIKKTFKKELDLLESEEYKYLKEKSKENHKVSLDETSVQNAALNHLLSRLVKKNKDTGKYEITENYALFKAVADTQDQWEFTDDGLAFFLSMFLTKKEGLEFRSRIKGFKDKNGLRHNLTQWIFSYPAFRKVGSNFETTFSKDSFVFQVIDELTKVPDEIYRNLSKDKQDEFLTDMNTYFKDREKNTYHTPEEETVTNPVIRKRYEDKFEYFALRYLDEFAGFKRIRFQVYLGDYIHDSREKKIGSLHVYTERQCRERIKTFGKLSELKSVKTDFFIRNETPEIPGWRRFPNPSYRIENHNILIELDIEDEDNQIKNRIKKSQESLDKESKEEWSDRKKGKIVKTQMFNDLNEGIKPKHNFKTSAFIAQMSLNELPALLFALLVKHEKAEDIEDQIIQAYKEHFHALENGKGMHLPKTLLSPEDETLNREKLKRDIRLILDDTKERLDSLNERIAESQSIHSHHHIFNAREMGETVSFFAKDLLRFMPVTYRQNWKGYMHSEWQALLSHYEVNRQSVSGLLFSCWQEEKTPNDLYQQIHSMFLEKTFENLYEKYLTFRKNYMEHLSMELDNSDGTPRLERKVFKEQGVWNYFNKRLYIHDKKNLLADRLLARPLILPRGLFDSKPTYIKNVDPNINPEQFASWYVFPYEEKYGIQEFYQYPLNYEDNFAEYEKKSESIRQNRYKFSEDRQKELFKRKEQAKIRNVKRKDALLYLIVKELLQKMGVTFSLKQNSFYLPPQTVAEKERAALTQKNRHPGDKNENILKDTYIWNMPLPFIYKWGIGDEKKEVFHENNIKVKDHRTLSFYMKEKKVKTLFSYDPSHVWDRKSLEKELQEYEKIRRESLLVEIHHFEQYVLKLYGWNEGEECPDDLSKANNIPKFKYFVFNTKLGLPQNIVDKFRENNELIKLRKEEPEIFNNPKVLQSYWLLFIRNCFAHNEFPKVSFFRECSTILPKDNSNTYAEYYFLLVKKIITSIIPSVNRM